MTISFADLKLIESLQKALVAENYTHPTPIQAQAIPHLLEGRDLLGCAQTGTGKTAAFALPILQHLANNPRKAMPRHPRVLVLSPTRELAVQIHESFRTYGKNVHFRQSMIFGGVGQQPQVRALTMGVHVVVATPGRLLDLMNQGHIQLDQLEVFVLDEADRMLDMGFLPDVKRIISKLPRQRQSLFFSATMPDSIADLANNLLRDPVTVEITPPATTVELIEQHVMYVKHADKLPLLDETLKTCGYNRCLVFTRTKHGADRVAEKLARLGHSVDAIHGNKSQNARQRALNDFRNGKLSVLIATDLAARGIDVDGISHVFNFDIPHEPESYVHRIGRTGRAGASGIAISFCDPAERGELAAIEKLTKRPLMVNSNHPYHVDVPRPAARHGKAPAFGGKSSAKKHRPSRFKAASTQGKGWTGPKPPAEPAAQGRRRRRQFAR